MARKLPVVHADGRVLMMTPNQCTEYEMNELKCSLLSRVGHFSLGFVGIRWSKGRDAFVEITELTVQRRYPNLGATDDEPFEFWSIPEHARSYANMRLGTLDNLAQALKDLPNHPLAAELWADHEAERRAIWDFLHRGPFTIRATIKGKGERAGDEPIIMQGTALDVTRELKTWMMDLDVLEEEDGLSYTSLHRGNPGLVGLRRMFAEWFSEEHELSIEVVEVQA